MNTSAILIVFWALPEQYLTESMEIVSEEIITNVLNSDDVLEAE